MNKQRKRIELILNEIDLFKLNEVRDLYNMDTSKYIRYLVVREYHEHFNKQSNQNIKVN